MGVDDGGNHDREAKRNPWDKLKYPFTALFILVLASCVAQDNHLLFHYNRYKEHVYKTGDIISFRVKGNETKLTWQITGLTDSTIVSQEKSVKPEQISHLYVDKETLQFFAFRYKWARLLFAAGVGYAAIDIINSGEFNKTTALISGSMICAAGVAAIFIKEHIKLKRPRKLVILRG